MSIGSIIKATRKQKDLTQEQFAEYFNVSVSAVSQWERVVQLSQKYPVI